MKIASRLSGAVSLFIAAVLMIITGNSQAEVGIISPKDASPLESLAAREAARYFYLRTNLLAQIRHMDKEVGPERQAIVIARKDRAVLTDEIKKAAQELKPQQYLLKTTGNGDGRTLWIVGGDDTGTLYGVYRFAERLGVRFYLHGDVIPDARMAPVLPDLDETGKPLFDIRGIQPFHDFPEGPDWWNRDDYLSYIHQLAKLRMNFLGLHCYPEGGVGPEPGVWIGLERDANPDGTVRFSSQSAWASTARAGTWGYAAMKTGDFCAGAAQLFEADDFGPDVQRGMMPRGRTPAEHNAIFNNAGGMLRDAFAEARALGVKTCIGTETPLTIPKLVQEHIQSLGKDPKDIKTVQEVYKGMFSRIARTCPVDYYWLWTPEGWTWGGNRPEQFQATVDDVRAALAALKELGDPFTLATSGWVLGPQHDRAALDKELPKNVPMSCINRVVGHEAVEPGFANITGRPKWAIPWMENDPNLAGPQPWAGRMRVDAATALRYGCTGLLGIHWRTKILAMNVAALADAAWDQSWVPGDFKVKSPQQKAAEDTARRRGRTAAFKAPVTGATEPAIYQTVRYNMDGYAIKVPNGTYAVTLKFNEPHYDKAGVRVFGVWIQGKPAIDTLDIFGRVGKNHALDFPFRDVVVSDGILRLDFIKKVEFPCIAGIVIQGDGFVKKINCGGPALNGYEADDDPADPNAPNAGKRSPDQDRTLPVGDFYADFARAAFGPEAGEPAGRIFARIDGTALPEPTTWTGGPGGIKPNPEPWNTVKTKYAFVDELAALRPAIKSPGDLERFDYWLNTYRFMAAMAEAGCRRGELDAAMAGLNKEKNARRRAALRADAVRARIALARAWERMIAFQIAATDTPGELGTLANLEQHSRLKLQFIEKYDKELVKALGKPLPEEANLSMAYTGPARIIVPTVRTMARPGESVALKVIVVAADGQATGELCWRPLGRGEFQSVPLARVARSVFAAKLPAIPSGSLGVEYYLKAQSGGRTLLWPASAPNLCQTVIAGTGHESGKSMD